MPPGEFPDYGDRVETCETRSDFVQVPGADRQAVASPYSCIAREKGRRIMSRWTDDPTDPTTPEMVGIFLLSSPPTGDLKPRCWEIGVWGREVQQRPPVLPAEGYQPWSVSQISTDDHQITKLKARIRFYNAEGGNERIFDIGEGVRTNVIACSVQLDIYVPVEYIFPDTFAGQNAGQQWATGLILNSLVGAWIGETCMPAAKVPLTNTETLLVAAGDADARVQIPPGARRLSMYQTRAGGVMDPFWSMEDINNPTTIGAIILGADRSVEHLDRPGSARTVAIGAADQQDDRVVTLVWELEG